MILVKNHQKPFFILQTFQRGIRVTGSFKLGNGLIPLASVEAGVRSLVDYLTMLNSKVSYSIVLGKLVIVRTGFDLLKSTFLYCVIN